MKVLLLTGMFNASAGGVYYALKNLLQAKNDSDEIEFHVIGISGNDDSHEMIYNSSVRISLYKCIGPKGFAYIPNLYHIIKNLNPDLIDVHGCWTNHLRVTNLYCKRNNVPYIVNPHGMLDSWALKSSRLKKLFVSYWFQKKTLEQASCIRVLNRSEENSVYRYCRPKRCFVIPNFLSSKEFAVVAKNKLQSNSGVKFLYLGRYDKKKNLEELLHAWSMVNQEIQASSSTLILHGWGDERYISKLSAIIELCGIKGSCELKGKVDGVVKTKLIRESDFVLLPSLSEGQPMVIIESLAQGTPVFITEACNFEEIHSNNIGFVIGTQRAQIASIILKSIKTNCVEYGIMSYNGTEVAKKYYHEDICISQILGMYTQVLVADI